LAAEKLKSGNEAAIHQGDENDLANRIKKLEKEK